ncbi:hypothetical protein AB0N09_05595 [Streptomyces erythrochromogenes]|uniref:hypothetical protein n=1 Tax=Streptomyces erythrochromogenes TaxID=285574 RepID=UPI0034382AE3
MCVITCPVPECKRPGSELIGVPIPHTDETANAARCPACGHVWALDPGADGGCRECGGSGTVWGAGRLAPPCACHESHTQQPADPGAALTASGEGPSKSPIPAEAQPSPLVSWRRTGLLFLVTLLAAGSALAAGGEAAWWIYQNSPVVPGLGAHAHDRFLWAFSVGAMAMVGLGGLGGAAVDRIERWGTSGSSWR